MQGVTIVEEVAAALTAATSAAVRVAEAAGKAVGVAEAAGEASNGRGGKRRHGGGLHLVVRRHPIRRSPSK